MKSQLIPISRFLGYITGTKLQVNQSWDYTFLSPPKQNSFGGYYDAKIVNNGEVIFHGYDPVQNSLVHSKNFNIFKYNLESKRYNQVGTSAACNWQIGSRLNWTEEGNIFYNDIDDGHLMSKLVRENGALLHRFENPFWFYCEKYNVGVTLNFAELSKRRAGYGYMGRQENCLPHEIKFLNLKNEKLIFNVHIEDLNLKTSDRFYFNHVIANTDRTVFLTTLNSTNLAVRRVIPVLVFPFEEKTQILSDIPSFSHPSFISNEEMIYFSGSGYIVYNFKNGEKITLHSTGRDGHPTLINMDGKSHLITDTYPDKFSKFSCYELSNDKITVDIVTVRNPPGYTNDLRCDLHPRINNFSEITLDIPQKFGRELMYMKRKGEGAFSSGI